MQVKVYTYFNGVEKLLGVRGHEEFIKRYVQSALEAEKEIVSARDELNTVGRYWVDSVTLLMKV